MGEVCDASSSEARVTDELVEAEWSNASIDRQFPSEQMVWRNLARVSRASTTGSRSLESRSNRS